ncbi:endothelin-3 [Dromiciops gliroides]|uniref:endothelin-3 n=1 Tax=Dromiciops gliroides TaxID=33562 RepID=UPI001CC73661|nr:endothelin-3 [Dromiciops gliroides]
MDLGYGQWKYIQLGSRVSCLRNSKGTSVIGLKRTLECKPAESRRQLSWKAGRRPRVPPTLRLWLRLRPILGAGERAATYPSSSGLALITSGSQGHWCATEPRELRSLLRGANSFSPGHFSPLPLTLCPSANLGSWSSGLWFLFGLTVTSTAGFLTPSVPRQEPGAAGGGGGPRVPAARESDGEENEMVAFAKIRELSPTGAGQDKGEDGPREPRHASMGAEGSLARKREKRCTCYTYKDKECVYYCHLDIIWINTPERTVPYGLSNYRGSIRGKRSADPISRSSPTFKGSLNRCSCTKQDDDACIRFCTRTEDNRSNSRTVKTHQDKDMKQPPEKWP